MDAANPLNYESDDHIPNVGKEYSYTNARRNTPTIANLRPKVVCRSMIYYLLSEPASGDVGSVKTHLRNWQKQDKEIQQKVWDRESFQDGIVMRTIFGSNGSTGCPLGWNVRTALKETHDKEGYHPQDYNADAADCNVIEDFHFVASKKNSFEEVKRADLGEAHGKNGENVESEKHL